MRQIRHDPPLITPGQQPCWCRRKPTESLSDEQQMRIIQNYSYVDMAAMQGLATGSKWQLNGLEASSVPTPRSSLPKPHVVRPVSDFAATVVWFAFHI